MRTQGVVETVVTLYGRRRSGLPEEDCGAASGVATKTVSPVKASARLDVVRRRLPSGGAED